MKVGGEMNSLIENGSITEMKCDTNFAYILNDNSMFLSTQYKVLQSRTDDCFVRCMKMLYNGKIQLYFFPVSSKPLRHIIFNIDVSKFCNIIANLFHDIMEVKSNGFLSCQNIDLSFDHIYIDVKTYKVGLVYLPLNCPLYEDYSLFENQLRTDLIKLITNTASLSSPKMHQFVEKLADDVLTLEDLSQWLKNDAGPSSSTTYFKDRTLPHAEQLYLVSMDHSNYMEMLINKDEFLIGRKASCVDGVIEFNKMIGRVHCKINKSGKSYSITDLNSANGTYVNQKRLLPNQTMSIYHDDIIRLANSDFKVRVG